jgi:hypothetical protein
MASFISKFSLAVLLAMVAGNLAAPEPAEAGTPYTCVCNGKDKRFIGATRGCEIDRDRAQGIKRPGVTLLKLPRCSTAEAKAWRASACRSNGCKPKSY